MLINLLFICRKCRHIRVREGHQTERQRIQQPRDSLLRDLHRLRHPLGCVHQTVRREQSPGRCSARMERRNPGDGVCPQLPPGAGVPAAARTV